MVFKHWFLPLHIVEESKGQGCPSGHEANPRLREWTPNITDSAGREIHGCTGFLRKTPDFVLKPVLLWFVLATCLCCDTVYRLGDGHIFNPDSLGQMTAGRSICSLGFDGLFWILGDEPKHSNKRSNFICVFHLSPWEEIPRASG